MKTTALLHNLTPYLVLLEGLQQKGKGAQWKRKLVCQYSFIVLELYKQVETTDELYLQITFEVQANKVVLKKLYCEEDDRRGEWETFIHHNTALQRSSWKSNSTINVYLNESFTQFLDIADSIASVGMHYNRGDDYRPGFYSSVAVTEDEIVLSQINFMNSRSLSHKDNYSLRKLVMHLSFSGKPSSVLHYDHKIGDLKINFSDSSSKNNRACGDAILLKIITFKGAFDSMP